MSVEPRTILITGGAGMLAWDLDRVLEARLPKAQRQILDRTTLDIANPDAVENVMRHLRPDWVLNAAAYTNVDLAETQRELALRGNAVGPETLAAACEAHGAKLVHFSTDQVFDGTASSPRSETDEPNPINHYGMTKLRGEQAALKSPGALVLRVQWLYGERKDRFRALRQKDRFEPFSDQIGAPTWTREIATGVCELLERGESGLFHFAYDDYASWAEVFEFVREQWGLDHLVLQPRKTAEAGLPAERPHFSVLSNAKIKGALGPGRFGSWKDPLRAFLEGGCV